MAVNEALSVEEFQQTASAVVREVGRVIVGQDEVVRYVLICVIAGGHALLEGVPGLGKTTLIRTLSEVLHLKFSRIQFTPDLMPADITGTNVIEETVEGSKRDPFLPTCCWRTKSTEPRPKRNPRCWKRCRKKL
jgi:MoxR-like ATPase